MLPNEKTDEMTQKSGVSPEEFDRIKGILGRTPNQTELYIFAAMWSEHTSYRHSLKWIKKLPRKGDCVLVEAGTENAGLINIGNGLACAFKIESHNHPCAVEPFHGASTGVGGINRDIFTMGAKPIAQLNSLRFGNLNSKLARQYMKKVVQGIGYYNNAFGTPMIAGEIFFDGSFTHNPLVNTMSVGIVKQDSYIKAVSKGTGNLVYLLGAPTGEDGIRGAVFASKEITGDSVQELASVQVGDPFIERLLLEAILEMNETRAIAGMQDLGASGIACAVAEMSSKGHHGMRIDLDKIPLRSIDMDSWEIVLSETQERMILVVKKGHEKKIEAVAAKWNLICTQIGEVIQETNLLFYDGSRKVAELPVMAVNSGDSAAVDEREVKEPEFYQKLKSFSIQSVPEPKNLKEVFFSLLKNPNLASKRWIYEQFDTMAGVGNMAANFPSDAGVVNVKGTDSALLMTVDCNGRYVKANPEKGTQIAVAEAARNIVCTGGEPLAVTNCMNFGNPDNPEVYWQFVSAIKGMAKACSHFNLPVTGGNVSFYNQYQFKGETIPVMPTPVIGMVGLLKDKSNHMTLAFKSKGDMIYLVGKSKNDISSSEYLHSYHHIEQSPAPCFNLEEELKVQQVVKLLIQHHLIRSCHDVSNGGLIMTLVESAVARNLGFDITTDAEIRTDAFLFGESQSRIVVSVASSRETEFLDFMMSQAVPYSALGHVTKEELRIDDVSFGFISDIKKEYENALEVSLNEPTII